MALLIDIGNLSERQTDLALSEIYKAIHNHDDDSAIWDQHPSQFVRRLAELFTDRGLKRFDKFRAELEQWIAGEKHVDHGEVLPRPAGMMQRWTPSEISLARIYLENLPPDEFKLDDWMMVVDYLVQRYLPADEMRTEAEWLAVRSSLMGKVQANMENLTAAQADTVLSALPLTVGSAVKQFSLNPIERSVMEFGVAHCAEAVSRVTDDVRHRMRSLIMRDYEEKVLHVPGVPGQSLQTKLHDEFATLNRDWRRIAVTETTENLNQGYVAGMKPGSKVKRVEQYRGACPFCRKIDGKVMEVVAADAENKDGETQIWPGKTNVGRSAAPRRRQAGVLVAREPHEMWWVPAGAAHPNCRGRWVPMIEDQPGDDAEFGDWLRATLSKGKKNAAD